ncbi:MAG: RNA ligase family protein [Candidatus Thorarchaeota archaeon]|jgi:hypothetical protein
MEKPEIGRKGLLRSYPKVYAIGHKAVSDLFKGDIFVQEKVDGSQFSFGVIDGELYCRSKRQQIHLPTDEALFIPACETAVALFHQGLLVEGWTYRGEAIFRCKHNALEYSRTPKGGVILFDIDTGLEDRLTPPELAFEASKLGLECVPLLHFGEINDPKELLELLEYESCLGGTEIEGVVVKNYGRWGMDGKQLMGKFVSEKFKETHRKAWGASNKSKTEAIEALGEMLRTDARWQKAVQHLREEGVLENEPRDIGNLIVEVHMDIESEEIDMIKDYLWRAFRRGIMRKATAGLPEWYKRQLLEGAFDE